MSDRGRSISSLTDATGGDGVMTRSAKKASAKDKLCVVTDADGQQHTLKKLPTCGLDQLRYRCNWCHHFNPEGEHIKTAYYCMECHYGFCVHSYRCRRDCWDKHCQCYDMLAKVNPALRTKECMEVSSP